MESAKVVENGWERIVPIKQPNRDSRVIPFVELYLEAYESFDAPFTPREIREFVRKWASKALDYLEREARIRATSDWHARAFRRGYLWREVSDSRKRLYIFYDGASPCLRQFLYERKAN